MAIPITDAVSELMGIAKSALKRRFLLDPSYDSAQRAQLVDLLIADLAARILLPDVHHIVETRDVALFVEADVADDGRELAAGMHFVGDLLGLDRIGGLCGELNDLDRGVAVERVGFRLEVLGTEFINDRLGFRTLTRIWAIGHERTLDARAANRGEF